MSGQSSRASPTGGTNRHDTVIRIVGASALHRAALAAVTAEAPAGAAIGAGFVRTLVWDTIAGRRGPAGGARADVDVVFHDPADISTTREAAIERHLARALPGLRWEVRNQARMHLGRRAEPFRSLADAIAHWPETATAIAVRLGHQGDIELIAPHGVDDLLSLVVRAVPGMEAACLARWAAKRWRDRWPVRLAHID